MIQAGLKRTAQNKVAMSVVLLAAVATHNEAISAVQSAAASKRRRRAPRCIAGVDSTRLWGPAERRSGFGGGPAVSGPAAVARRDVSWALRVIPTCTSTRSAG